MVAESHAIERRNAALARGGRKTAGTFCPFAYEKVHTMLSCGSIRRSRRNHSHVASLNIIPIPIVSRNLLFYSIVKGIKVFAYSGQFKQFWKPLDDC